MISGLIGRLAKKQRRPEKNSGLNRGLGPMTVRLCCNALPSQPSEIHVSLHEKMDLHQICTAQI